MRNKLLTTSASKAVILLFLTVLFLYALLGRDSCWQGCDYDDVDDETVPFATLVRPGWKGSGRSDNSIHFAEFNRAVVDIKGGRESLPPPKRDIKFTA